MGIDISYRKLKWAKENCTKNTEFVVCDATHLPFRSSSFDFVLCSEVIEHLLEPLEALKEIGRVCKRHVLITTPTKTTFWRLLIKRFRGRDIPYGPTHIYEYSQEELVKLLGEVCAVRIVSAAPLLEFPGIFLLLRSHRLARALYALDKMIASVKIFSRFGVFSCVLCSKQG